MYWSTSPTDLSFPIIQKAMGLKRFQQIKRYFKVFNIEKQSQIEMQGKDWWKKVNLLVSNFREWCCHYIKPGQDVSINELLIQCFGWSKHTFQIPNKAASQGYKLYAICQQRFLIDFVFSSRTEKITEIQISKDERITSTLIKKFMTELKKRDKGRCNNGNFIEVRLLKSEIVYD